MIHGRYYGRWGGRNEEVGENGVWRGGEWGSGVAVLMWKGNGQGKRREAETKRVCAGVSWKF